MTLSREISMFGESKLLETGVPAQAVILDARPGNLLNRHGERKWGLQLRVHFEDGQSADIACDCFDLSLNTTGPVTGLEPYPFTAGTVLPVRYDRGDRSKVEIDRPKIIAETISTYEANRAKKIERAEQQFASPAVPSQASKETDENYLMEELAAAQTRGDSSEVQRLTGLLEAIISGS
jgi:hypothetical protein